MKKTALILTLACFTAAVGRGENLPTVQLQEFVKNCIESSGDPLDPKMEGSSFNWEFTGKYKVIFANKTYFSYCAEELSYTGGAHGNFTVSAGTHRRDNGRRLTLNEIAPTGEDRLKLRSLLFVAASQHFKCSVRDLSKVLLKLPYLTENFYLDKDNIVFVFNEYEIASKGAGPIKLSIPFTQYPVKL